MRWLVGVAVFWMGCSPKEASVEEENSGAHDDATWDALGDDTGTESEASDKEDDTGAGWGDFPPCGDEVIAGEECEGDWETTTCIDEDEVYWWCEDGVWSSDK